MTQLLVSVRSVREADEALAGGADLIDLKEPKHGPLGPVDDRTSTQIVRNVAGRRPMSRACGELTPDLFAALPRETDGFQYLKVGLAGNKSRDWRSAVRALQQIVDRNTCSRLVVVAYADHTQAEAPPPEAVLDFAIDAGLTAWMIDTWSKDSGHVFAWQTVEAVRRWGMQCRRSGLAWALAGSLRFADVTIVRDLSPTWVAVRGSACRGGRNGTLDRELVAAWKKHLEAPHSDTLLRTLSSGV